MDREDLNKKFGVTEEQLDAWAEACERDEYPGKPIGEIIIGRPLMFGGELKPVTFKEPQSKVAAIDSRAASLNLSRSDYLRLVVDKDLATA
jgi:hypothetical protein